MTAAEAKPEPPPPMHCVGCSYELVGLEAGACPECGRDFDPADPSTFTAAPRVRLRQRLRRVLLLTAAVLGVMAALHFAVLPRPAIDARGRPTLELWNWLGRPFGVDRFTSGWREVEHHYFGSDVVRRVVVRDRTLGPDAPMELVLSMKRLGGGRWSLEMPKAGVPLSAVISHFNLVRSDDEFFGVGLQSRPRVVDDEGTVVVPRDPVSSRAVRVTGPKEDLLTEIVLAYDVTLVPFLLSDEDTDVWIFDEALRRVVRIPVTEAEGRGIEIDPDPRAIWVNRIDVN